MYTLIEKDHLGDWKEDYLSRSLDSYHPDDLSQWRYVTPAFKPYSYLWFFYQRHYHLCHLHFVKIPSVSGGTKDLRQSGSLLNPKSLFLFNESSNLGYLPYLACGGVRPFSRTPGRCRDVPLVKQCASGYCHPTKSSTGIMRKGQLQNFIALPNKISE